MNHSPLAFHCGVTLSPPSPSDKTADADRLAGGLQRQGLEDVTVPLDILRRLPAELRRSGFRLDLVIGLSGEGLRILDVGKTRVFGIALDIGSTNIECLLYDLGTGEKIGEAGVENPQVYFGYDVLTRVQRSMTGEFADLVRSLSEGIRGVIARNCEMHGIASDEIYAVTVAGNTIMSHFFLGLDVDNIPLSPYIPVVNRSFFADAGGTGLPVNSNAVVYVFPNAGSYVGGDVISGILFSGLYREEEPALFIDVGTNVEITLGCRDWIMVGAGAAGPALEGGVANIGKKAEAGTISRVRIDRRSRKIALEVIGGTEPGGICGSGLIDLVSEMYSAGIIDQSGKFNGGRDEVIERDGVKSYLLFRSGDTGLYLNENEIKNFLLSKAAMFSFLYVFVRSVGLSFRDIKKVYVAGALGCGIDPEKAITIGMLPDIPRERFLPLGNSSIGGAGEVLLQRGLLKEVEDIASKITYREMNEDAELMHVLQGAMFIPHTDPEILKG
ncbi:MAG: ASKHA domain-containing protein [Nitrospiraceae bacterium]|nr:ASKHA domain-containing protein [Nitrospiraceae bacterium]